MAKNKSRLEMLVGNMLLQGDAEDCFIEWKKTLIRYQKSMKLPQTKTNNVKRLKLRTKLEELSWQFIKLTGYKPSARDAIIGELIKTGDIIQTSPVKIMLGLGSQTISLAEYEADDELKALRLPLHIVVETNTTVEEIKQFVSNNKKQISLLLSTQKVGTLDPLHIERDKAIKEYAKQGMPVEEIAIEIDAEPKYAQLHGEDGISVGAVEKVIQRKAK